LSSLSLPLTQGISFAPQEMKGNAGKELKSPSEATFSASIHLSQGEISTHNGVVFLFLGFTLSHSPRQP
jgi:hypothetical protein